MHDEHKDAPEAPTAIDEESTGNAALDKRLASGVLRGDSGTEAAQVWISAFLIAALGFVVYLGSFSIPLHGDDLALFHGSTALHRIVTSPGALEQLPTAPLSALGLAVAYTVTGGGVDGLHGFSILVHLCCAILVFLVARRLLPSGAPEALAMLAGMAFAAHPLATGTVNYLTAYPVLQSSFFGLLALVLLLRGAAQSSFCVASLGGAVCGFVLAFGSDTSALLYPLLGLALVQLRPGGAVNPGYARATVAVLVLLMASLWVAGRASGVLPTVCAGSRLGAFFDLSGNLLMSAVWPFRQPVLAADPGLIAGLAGTALLAGGLVAGILFRQATAVFSAAWVLLGLFGIACYGDPEWTGGLRYLYFPFAGLALMLPWAVIQFRAPAAHRIAGGAAALLILVLGALSFQRTETWKQPAELWGAEAARNPESVAPLLALAHFHTAVAALSPVEEPRERENLSTAAVNAWRAVLDRVPGDPEAEKNLGIMTASAGKFDEARPLLESASEKLPEDQDVALYLARVIEQLARTATQREDILGALRAYRRAARLGPLPVDAQASYGMLAASFGDLETGLPLLQAAAGLEEESPLKGAVQQFSAMAEQLNALDTRAQTALRENPGSVDGLLAQSERLLIEGKALSAFYILQMIVEAAPAHDGAWAMLGLVSARLEGSENFLAEWGAGRAGNASAWEQLALRCAAGGAWDAAEAYLRHGIGQTPGAMPELKLAGIAQQLHQAPRAAAFLEAAQKAYPDSALPWLQHADMSIVAQDFARARGQLDEAEKRGAAPEEIQSRRDKLGGQGTIPSGIQRTVIR